MKAFVFIAVMFWTCAGSTDGAKDDVRVVVSGILDADNHADIERVLSYYQQEAVLMPPGRDEIKGLANIRRNYENIFATSLLNLAPEEEQIIVTNEFVVYKGRTKGQVIAKSDSTARSINDKFIMILKKDDGSWKISTLIWN